MCYWKEIGFCISQSQELKTTRAEKRISEYLENFLFTFLVPFVFLLAGIWPLMFETL